MPGREPSSKLRGRSLGEVFGRKSVKLGIEQYYLVKKKFQAIVGKGERKRIFDTYTKIGRSGRPNELPKRH